MNNVYRVKVLTPPSITPNDIEYFYDYRIAKSEEDARRMSKAAYPTYIIRGAVKIEETEEQ